MAMTDLTIRDWMVIIGVLLILAVIIAVFGIANTLALSIFERTREIGLLRALGVGAGEVQRLFLLESVVLGGQNYHRVLLKGLADRAAASRTGEALRERLESHYREVQDFEFTIERGRLYCLQTRNGKMNAIALVRTSVEMANAGLLDRNQALLRIDPAMLEQLLFPRLDPNRHAVPVARGLPASPGAAAGKCVFDADLAEKLGRGGEQVILVREETRPEDIHGKRVLVLEDGPTVTHGGMAFGAGTVAAQSHNATPVDPRPYAVGTIADTYANYPHMGAILPAMGYSEKQRESLARTIKACAEAEGIACVVNGSPARLDRVIDLDVPLVRVTYRFEQLDGQPIEERVMALL